MEIIMEEEIDSKGKKKAELHASGLCGIWQDERTSEEIINDIYSHITGFGNRQVEKNAKWNYN
jgi:hypothetical protein